MLDKNNIPKHIAIIMDGNGRWAKERKKLRLFGHASGYRRIAPIVEKCLELGVECVSLYAFSSENWTRPQNEILGIMKLLKVAVNQQINNAQKKGIKFVVSGRLDEIREPYLSILKDTIEKTKNNTNITLNLCFNYGGRNEIVDAFKKCAEKISNGEMKIEDINEEIISQNLYHPEIPDPDLLIRTAGELRISNFLLWELAYSEIYVTDKYWPDFSNEELEKAILNYQNRERRFGGLNSK